MPTSLLPAGKRCTVVVLTLRKPFKGFTASPTGIGVDGWDFGFVSITSADKEIALIVPSVRYQRVKHRIGKDMSAIQRASVIEGAAHIIGRRNRHSDKSRVPPPAT